MLFQHYNYGFSVPVVFRSKAQCEGNGHSLVEYCNAVAGHHRDALRVSLSTPKVCVVSLDKGTAKAGPVSEASALGSACESASPKAPTCGAVNVDKLTEIAIIMLKEH